MAYIDGKETLFSAQMYSDGAEIVGTLGGNEEDKAPSVKAVNAGLAGKLDAVTEAESLEQIYGVNTSGKQKMFSTYAGNKNGIVAKFTSQDSSLGNKNYGSGVLITDTPTKPFQCANKKYVDDTAAALRDELGTTVQIVSVSGDKYGGWYIPAGALPNFYLETTEFEYDAVDGVRRSANFTELSFYDVNGVLISKVNAQSDTYYGTPSGAVQIKHNAAEMNDEGKLYPSHDINGNMYMPNIIFQVEV